MHQFVYFEYEHLPVPVPDRFKGIPSDFAVAKVDRPYLHDPEKLEVSLRTEFYFGSFVIPRSVCFNSYQELLAAREGKG